MFCMLPLKKGVPRIVLLISATAKGTEKERELSSIVVFKIMFA